jgi:two-component system LytT family response regulator
LEPKESPKLSGRPFAITRGSEAAADVAQEVTLFPAAHSTASLEQVLSCLHDLKRERVSVEMFLISQRERSFFVRVCDVDWIESSRNHVLLHVGSLQHVYHATTSEIEERLNPRRFMRIHRSAIVNIEKIKEIQTWFNGSCRVTLRDGTLLTMSSPYRQKLFRRMSV